MWTYPRASEIRRRMFAALVSRFDAFRSPPQSVRMRASCISERNYYQKDIHTRAARNMNPCVVKKGAFILFSVEHLIVNWIIHNGALRLFLHIVPNANGTKWKS